MQVQSIEETTRPSPTHSLVRIPRPYRNRLTRRLVKEHLVSPAYAEVLVIEAEKFLNFTATSVEPGSPSPAVDLAWHEMILYTRQYSDYCDTLSGGFIHHGPSDDPNISYERGGMRRTFRSLVEAGYEPDPEVWQGGHSATVSSCTNYCTGSSCAGSGCDGDSGCSHR